MSDYPPTMPPNAQDELAMAAYELQVAEHDQELRDRGVPSSGLLRALALSHGLDVDSVPWSERK